MNNLFKSFIAKATVGLVALSLLAFAGAMVAHAAYDFSSMPNMKLGAKGINVQYLQKVLNMDADTMIAASGAGSPGMETTTFGGLTKAAVIKFQKKHNVVPSIGNVYTLTRAALDAFQANFLGGSASFAPAGCTSASGYSPLYGVSGGACHAVAAAPSPVGCIGTNPPNAYNTTDGTACPLTGQPVIVTGGALTATLASTNPASNTLATGTASNPVLAFNLANGTASPVSVVGLNLTKAGYFANTDISGVAVYDGNGVRHGNVVTTLGAAGVANMTFVTDPIVVPAGQVMTVWVKVDLSGTAGGVVSFNINKASDIVGPTTVGGVFPIMGNQMSVVDGTASIGAVTLDELPLNASGVSLNADANSSQDIAKFRVQSTNSNEDVQVTSLTLWNNGNAASTDYKDVKLVDQTGVLLATAQPVGQNVTFNLATPYTITKGQTKDFWVKATIVNGASRTIQFVVYNNYDLAVKGMSTMAYLLPSAGTNDTSFPIGDSTSTYNKVTVASGSLVFTRATDSPSTAVTPGANDVVLAKYNAKPVGENMELRGVTFGLDQNTGSTNLTGTVYVKVNGSVVYSAAANTTNFAADGTVAARTLSSYPVLTAGVDNTIEVTASISSSATSADAYFVNDFDVTSVKRLITNDIQDPATSTQDGFTRAVQSGTLVTTTLSTPVAASIVPGTNAVPLASFEFNASASGEDVRVTAVTVTDTLGAGSDYSGMTNLVMKDSSGATMTTSSSTATNAATVAFNFTNPIMVSRTATTKIFLYGDLLSTTGTSHTYKIASGNVTATGATTGNTITSSVAGSGQTMTTTASGTMAISTVSGAGATPSLTQLALVGQTEGTYLAGRLTAQYEALKATSITLKATGTFGVAATAQQDITNIRLYAQTGTGALSPSTLPFASTSQFSSCTTTVCTYTWTSADNLLGSMTIAPGSPVTIFAKADINGAGVVYLGDQFYMNIAETAQVVTSLQAGVAGTYALVINGTTVSTPFATDLATTGANLVTAINANATVSPYVTASGTTTVSITSDIEGLGFTVTDASSGGMSTTLTTTVANGGVAVKGAVSNTTLLAAATSGSASTSTATTNIVPQQILVTADAGFTGGNSAAANGTTLGRFKVANNGSAQITINSFKVTDSGSNSLTVSGTDTYKLWTSDDGSANYQANAASSTTSSLRDPSSGVTTWTVNQNNTINGGSYRYFTVTLNDSTGAASGNSWTMGVAALGDVTFTATEANLGYDGNQDGDLSDTTGSLYTDGKPTSATVTKQ